MSRNKSGKNRAAQKKANMKKNKKIIAFQKEQEHINRMNNYTSDEDEDDDDEYDDDEDDYEDDEYDSETEVEEFYYAIKALLKEKPHLVPHYCELLRTMEEKRAETEAERASVCKPCIDPERAEVENLLKVVDFLTGGTQQKNTNQCDV